MSINSKIAIETFSINLKFKELMIGESDTLKTLMQINLPNSCAYFDRKELKILTINTKNDVVARTINSAFPDYFPITGLSDDEANYIWQQNLLDAYLYDLTNQNLHHIELSKKHDNYIELGQVLIADIKKNIIIAEAIQDRFHEGRNADRGYYTFNMDTNEQSFKKVEKHADLGGVFRLDNSKLLFCEYDSKQENQKYFITDPGFQNYFTNKLTEKLTELNFNTFIYFKTFSEKKRILFGNSNKRAKSGDKQEPYMIRWDEPFNNIISLNLTTYMTEKKIYSSYANLNQDASWVAVLLRTDTGDEETAQWCFMQIYDNLSSGLSNPVLINENIRNNGVWMFHKIWGHCYIMNDSENPYAIKIYKMIAS